MPTLRQKLVTSLKKIPGVSVELYKDTALLCVYYNSKELAHFQTGSDCELDIRLSPALIKKEKLSVPKASKSHPDRSKNSRWIIQEFNRPSDVDNLVRLVKLAIELR